MGGVLNTSSKIAVSCGIFATSCAGSEKRGSDSKSVRTIAFATATNLSGGTIIHVVITLAAGYSVGSEFRRRDAREWLESAGGDPVIALVGKLAPLFGIFFLI